MKNVIEETTRLMLNGTLPKEEADKILLALHNVSQQRELLIDCVNFCDGLDLIENSTVEEQVDSYLLSINCG